MQKQRYIAVAGNMGVGKSTLVQFLSTQFGGEPYYEPVNTNPYFTRFFRDMKTWAFHSQLYFLVHKYKIHQSLAQKSGLVVLDRTIYEDAEIFAKGLFRTRKIKKDDFQLYMDIYESMCKTLKHPDILIYLTCSIKTLQERIAKRGRTAEKNVPVSYLKRIQKDYDQWIKRIDFCEVITIKTDGLDYISDLLDRQKVISHLEPFLK